MEHFRLRVNVSSGNTNGYKREGVQKVSAGRFETSKFITSNVGNGQNKNIRKLGNSYSAQLGLEGGERKAENHV